MATKYQSISISLAAAIVLLATLNFGRPEVHAAGTTSDVSSGLADLPSKSYALTSTLNVVYPGSDPQILRYDLRELHSSWQKRTKVSFSSRQPLEDWQVEANIGTRSHRSESWGTFYADEQQILYLKSIEDGTSRTVCKKMTRKLTDKMFSAGALDGYEQAPQHLIGASRLLSLLSSKRVQLSSTYAGATSAGSMRTIETPISYSYNYQSQWTITAHYSRNAANNLGHGLPLEIVVTKADSSVLFFYDFTRITLIENDKDLNLGDGSLASKQLGLSQAVEYPLFDMFALDRAIGCSRHKADDTDVVIAEEAEAEAAQLEGLARMNYRFSFKAVGTLTKVMTQNYFEPGTQMSVAYEPSISTLRVERSGATSSSSSTTNYYTGRNYHVMRKRAGASNSLLEQIVPSMITNSDDDEPVSCVVTKVTTSQEEGEKGAEAKKSSINLLSPDSTAAGKGEAEARNPFSLGEMLLGFKPENTANLRYLGLARVRGIEAKVYESYGSTWPIWLQAPIVYYESKNLIGVSNDEPKYRASAGRSPESEQSIWNTVIYLSRPGKSRSVSSGDDENDEEVGEITRNNLLLIEMFKLDSATLRVREHINFSVYDFAWHLTGVGHSMGPLRSEDFFSLGDTCVMSASHGSSSQYGQLEILLTLPGKLSEASSWLAASSRRDFALMQAMQEQLELPATAIYDIESRLELERQKNKKILLPTTLRLAERIRDINQLIYLGRGNFKKGIREEFIFFPELNFQACYLMVAHRRSDTIFAYSPYSNYCFIYKKHVIGTVKSTVDSTFAMLNDQAPVQSIRNSIEVYRVKCNGGPLQPETTRQQSTLERSHELLGQTSKLDLLNDFSINYDSGSALISKATLATFHARELTDTRRRSSLSGKSSEFDGNKEKSIGEPQVAANKFQGLGLVSSDALSTLVEPRRPAGQEAKSRDGGGQSFAKIIQVTSEITFGQCQAQCLSDLECGSFSWCVHGGRVECILSKVNFERDELAASQLTALQAKGKKYKFGQIFQVEIEAEAGAGAGAEAGVETTKKTVQIKRHPACELHNKQYGHLFDAQGKWVKFDLVEQSLHPVTRRDECAKLCLDKTLAVLKQDVGPAEQASLSALSQVSSAAAAAAAHSDDKLDERTIQMLFRKHKEAHAKLCTSFAFYDRASIVALGDYRMNKLARRVVRRAKLVPFSTGTDTGTGTASDNMSPKDAFRSDKLTNGYCLLGDSVSAAKSAQIERELKGRDNEEAAPHAHANNDDEDERIIVSLEQFAFNFGFMFDKQFGVALQKSEPLSEDVQAALYAVTTSSRGARVSRADLEHLREFVARGNNSVYWVTRAHAGDPLGCARMCFLQLVPLWPGCKSFEYLEEEAEGNGIKLSLCLFNSVTLRETFLRGRLDLVQDQESSDQREPLLSAGEPRALKIWHFEPKPSFVANSLEWSEALESNFIQGQEIGTQATSRSMSLDDCDEEHNNPIRLGSLGTFFCALIASSVGIILGVELGTILLRERSSFLDDTQNLVLADSNNLDGDHHHHHELTNGAQDPKALSIEFSDLTSIDRANRRESGQIERSQDRPSI